MRTAKSGLDLLSEHLLPPNAPPLRRLAPDVRLTTPYIDATGPKRVSFLLDLLTTLFSLGDHSRAGCDPLEIFVARNTKVVNGCTTPILSENGLTGKKKEHVQRHLIFLQHTLEPGSVQRVFPMLSSFSVPAEHAKKVDPLSKGTASGLLAGLKFVWSNTSTLTLDVDLHGCSTLTSISWAPEGLEARRSSGPQYGFFQMAYEEVGFFTQWWTYRVYSGIEETRLCRQACQNVVTVFERSHARTSFPPGRSSFSDLLFFLLALPLVCAASTVETLTSGFLPLSLVTLFRLERLTGIVADILLFALYAAETVLLATGLIHLKKAVEIFGDTPPERDARRLFSRVGRKMHLAFLAGRSVDPTPLSSPALDKSAPSLHVISATPSPDTAYFPATSPILSTADTNRDEASSSPPTSPAPGAVPAVLLSPPSKHVRRPSRLRKSSTPEIGLEEEEKSAVRPCLKKQSKSASAVEGISGLPVFQEEGDEGGAHGLERKKSVCFEEQPSSELSPAPGADSDRPSGDQPDRSLRHEGGHDAFETAVHAALDGMQVMREKPSVDVGKKESSEPAEGEAKPVGTSKAADAAVARMNEDIDANLTIAEDQTLEAVKASIGEQPVVTQAEPASGASTADPSTGDPSTTEAPESPEMSLIFSSSSVEASSVATSAAASPVVQHRQKLQQEDGGKGEAMYTGQESEKKKGKKVKGKEKKEDEKKSTVEAKIKEETADQGHDRGSAVPGKSVSAESKPGEQQAGQPHQSKKSETGGGKSKKRGKAGKK